MAQIIIMAKRYNKRPSEILGIDNDYLAYMFDETALYLESEVTDNEGNLDFNKIKWTDKKETENNKELMEFIQNNS